MRLLHLSKSRLIQLVFTSTLFLSLYSLWHRTRNYTPASASSETSWGHHHGQLGSNSNSSGYSNLVWGIATRLFVISLERRRDRRDELDRLFEAHDRLIPNSSNTNTAFGNTSELTRPSVLYIAATDSDNPVVARILAHVRWQRRKEQQEQTQRNSNTLSKTRRIRHSFTEALRKDLLEPWGSDLWLQPLDNSTLTGESESESYLPDEDVLDPDSDHPVFAERGNPFNPHKLFGVELETNTTESNEMPRGLNITESGILRPASLINLVPLTKGVIGCWHSHANVIRQIAMKAIREDSRRPTEVNQTYIILEDDVDFEWDIEARLTALWPTLPSDWDLVMLGHCWSNESRRAPIKKIAIHIDTNATSSLMRNRGQAYTTSLHPSSSPLCTHAYAISTRGAIHLSQLLRHPSFAYSRPLDQAFAWLIRNKIVKGAYSVVPPVVVQTKEGKSDIAQKGAGSRWRDHLVDGTKQRVQAMEQRQTGAG
ncbi:hypothetical protein FRC17_001709 [Serendipita sp. 399]|nr:hypothetical protein FRC17_001709 [Serendipita sp. 399]